MDTSSPSNTGATAAPNDISDIPVKPDEPKYGGFTRFEIELEFVQCLASPSYLLHLATSTTASTHPPTPLLQHGPFIAYLAYLAYWAEVPYRKFLMYPGPTLTNLALLRQERFRRDILSPEVVGRLGEEGVRATVERWNGGRVS